MEIVRGGQVARYGLLIYGLVDNDYQPVSPTQTPLHLWRLADFGLFQFRVFDVLVKAIHAFLAEKNIKDYFLNYYGFQTDTIGMVLEKYGEVIPDMYTNLMFRLALPATNAAILAESGIEQVGIVLWTSTNSLPVELSVNLELSDYQEGIHVPEDLPANLPAENANTAEIGEGIGAGAGAGAAGGGGRRSRSRKNRSMKRHTRRRHL
jgi:hypothetical protein